MPRSAYSRVLILAAIVVGIAVFYPRDSAEERIRALLEEAAQMAETERLLKPIEAAEKVSVLLGFFDAEVRFEIDLEEYERMEIVGQPKMKQAMLSAYTQLTRAEVALRNFVFDLGDDSARVDVDASFLGALRGESGNFLEMHRVRLDLRKDGSDWRISSVTHLKNLRASESGQGQ